MRAEYYERNCDDDTSGVIKPHQPMFSVNLLISCDEQMIQGRLCLLKTKRIALLLPYQSLYWKHWIPNYSDQIKPKEIVNRCITIKGQNRQMDKNTSFRLNEFKMFMLTCEHTDTPHCNVPHQWPADILWKFHHLWYPWWVQALYLPCCDFLKCIKFV